MRIATGDDDIDLSIAVDIAGRNEIAIH